MGRIAVQVDAARVNRGLAQAKNGRRRNTKADPVFLMWRHLLDHAVHDAKRTVHGFPTDSAILARWWIAEHRPKQNDKENWERSFECACRWLDLEPDAERKKLLELIDASLREAYLQHLAAVIYVRRAMVLTCAGMPTAIARQYELGLVSKKDYEDVAGIDYGDQFVMYDRPESSAA